MLNQYLENINKLNSSDEILGYLKDFYVHLKEDTKIEGLFTHDELNSNESHVKKLILNEKTNHGTLKFEVMYFTGKKYTPTHTHPEFVIDEVVKGKLEEKIYRCTDDGKYEFVKTDIRPTNDLRLINCDQGYPHEVIGLDKLNFTYCLSMGHEKVTPICESKIID